MFQKVQFKDVKKFIEDEKWEKGMVKICVYKVYFCEVGGFFVWGICLICFFVFEVGDLGKCLQKRVCLKEKINIKNRLFVVVEDLDR